MKNKEEVLSKRAELKRKLQELDKELDEEARRIEKARDYLVFDTYGEGRDMVERLSYAYAPHKKEVLCISVEGVVVKDEFDDTLTLSAFFALIS